jgi:IstB-like ATP binding protein
MPTPELDMHTTRRASNVILLSPPDVGKTHLAIAPGRADRRVRPSRLLHHTIDLVARLKKALDDHQHPRRKLPPQRKAPSGSARLTDNQKGAASPTPIVRDPSSPGWVNSP